MSELKNKLIPWLGRTVKMLDYHHTQKLRDEGFDLTKEQWILLKILSENIGISQNKIACITNRDKTATTRLINTLERKSYIARIPSQEDKRINLLYLTKKGEKILYESLPIVETLLADLQKDITPAEIDLVIDIMKRIQENINDTDGC